MQSNWAAEHLQVIRTLMERSAIYRRALAPVMVFVGSVGTAAALGGWFLNIDSVRGFITYWMAISAGTLAGAYLLIRRQAIQAAEPFWSPPTRRVTQALSPPFVAGLILGLVAFRWVREFASDTANVLGMLWLPLGWIVLYGCALHAAGFFLPRGVKLFGWVILLGACALFAVGIPDAVPRCAYAHGVMGLFFGGLHLAYGLYLYFTEQRKNEA